MNRGKHPTDGGRVAHLPSVSTGVTQHEGRHRLVSAASLDLRHTHTLSLPAFIFNWHRMCLCARMCVFVYLCVRAALPLTLVAGEHVCLGPAHLGQLMLSDGLFGQSFSHLLQLGTGHLLHTQTHTMRK